MVMATARRRMGGVGGGGVAWSRDGPPDAKKTGRTTRKLASWVLPPDRDAACVACRAAVREPYAQADDPPQPGRCMAEQPVQWWQETRVPIAATPPPGTRVADEDERHGTARICRCAEPLSGLRQATARARRTTGDWAIAVAPWRETR